MAVNGRLLDVLLRALGWNYSTGVVLLVAQMAYTAVTARTVSPADFGAYAVGLTLLQFTGYFGGATVGNAVMRAPTLDRREAATGLYFAMGLGVVLSGVLLAAAAPAAAVLRSPHVADVVYVLAVMPPATDGAAVTAGLLRRDDRYRAAALVNLGASLLGFAVGALLAVDGAGAIALVMGQVVGAWCALLAGVVALRRDLAVTFSPSAVRTLVPFAVQVSGQNLVHYLVEGAPLWFVSRTAGAAATGYFSRGYQLVALPAFQLVTGIQRSLYPLYYRLTDRARVGRALTDVAIVSQGVAGVVFGAAASCAPPAAVLLLGPDWTASVRLVPLLSLAFAMFTVYAVTASAAEALGWMGVIWRVQALFVALVLGGLALAVGHGLSAVAVVVAVGYGGSHLAMLSTRVVRRHVDLRRVAGAAARHLVLGVALYAVPTLVARAVAVTAPSADLAVRLVLTAGVLGAAVLVRGSVPAYAVVRRRWAGRGEAPVQAGAESVAADAGSVA